MFVQYVTRMCLQGECEKNPVYMVEGHTQDGEPVPGHCQLSCATCTLQVPSGSRFPVMYWYRSAAWSDAEMGEQGLNRYLPLQYEWHE